MRTPETNGRRILWVITGCLLVPSTFQLLALLWSQGKFAASSWAGELLLPAILCVFLLQGRAWARYVLIGLTILVSAYGPLVILLYGAPLRVQVTLAFMSALYMTVGSVLWASKSVEAYFQAKRH